MATPGAAPAFPSGTSAGISQRDYFAAAALTSICASSRSGDIHELAAKAAQQAYAYADAMLRARAVPSR